MTLGGVASHLQVVWALFHINVELCTLYLICLTIESCQSWKIVICPNSLNFQAATRAVTQARQLEISKLNIHTDSMVKLSAYRLHQNKKLTSLSCFALSISLSLSLSHFLACSQITVPQVNEQQTHTSDCSKKNGEIKKFYNICGLMI